MKCEDCLYFERCVVLGVELDIKHNKEADKNCRHFKNKADYAEVKHGEWIECFNEFNKYCSACNKIFGTIYDINPYCPNCGAKMDGRSDV